MAVEKVATELTPRTVKTAALIVCCLSQLLVVLDSTILNVALPTIARDLSLSDESLQGVINAFAITFAGLLLLAGRLSDLIGYRRMLFWSLAVFGIASLAGGLAPTSEVLLASRALQGVGAAGLAPTALALLSRTFTEPLEKAKALGIWGAAGGGGGALGVLLGGLIVEYTNWRLALFINVPICIWLMFGPLRSIPSNHIKTNQKIDYVGGALMTGALALAVLALVSTGSKNPLVPTAFLWVISGCLAIFFICNERWLTKSPILPLAPILRRGVVTGGLVMLIAGGALAGTFYFLTLMYQRVLGYSALETGLAYLPLSLAVFAGAGFAAIQVERIGGRLCLVAGSVLCLIGLLGFTSGSPQTEFWAEFLWWSISFGLGVGILITSTAAVATSAVEPGEQGLISGVLSTGQHLGGALGLAALVGISVSNLDGTTSSPVALASSYSAAFAVGAGLMAVAVIVALLAPPKVSQKTSTTGQ